MNNHYFADQHLNQIEQNFINNNNYYENSKNLNCKNLNYNNTYHMNQEHYQSVNYKSDSSFQSPNQNNTSIDNFKSNSQHTLSANQLINNNNNNNSINNNNKKSVKMSVPSNKRQILEEEFRKEKYPCNDKLQKISTRLNMKYDEVQNYFKKRRREEKETNNKFSNLVKLLNNYLEQE
jgi:hypothetical protein